MGTALRRRAYRVAILVVALGGLCSCLATYERQSARDFRHAGELERARDILSRLVETEQEPEDAVELRSLDREIAAIHFDRARSLLDRGFPRRADLELTRCLLHDPTHVPARSLAVRLAGALVREEAWEREFADALRDGRWERALELLDQEGEALVDRRTWGRRPELLELAWEPYRLRLNSARRPGSSRALAAAITDADRFLARHEALVECRLETLKTELGDARDRLRRLQEAEVLLTAARHAAAAGRHDVAFRQYQQALLRVPAAETVRLECFEARDQLVAHWERVSARSAQQRDWPRYFQAERALRRMGRDVPGPETVTPEEAREAGIRLLQIEAERAEEEGLPGQALLAIAEARALAPRDGALSQKWERLLARVRRLPLIEVREAGGPSNPGEAVRPAPAPALVLRGPARYLETRDERVERLSQVPLPDGQEWRDNPIYTAQSQLLERVRERATRLHQQLLRASPAEQKHLERRHQAALAERSRLEERLEGLDPRIRRSRWRRQESREQTLELRATLAQRREAAPRFAEPGYPGAACSRSAGFQPAWRPGWPPPQEKSHTHPLPGRLGQASALSSCRT